MADAPVIYLDYNATTPLDPGVRAVMLEALDNWGNPSSVHQLGRRARSALDDARDRVAAVFHCRPSELVFTAGGTEAANLAILGAARARRDRGRHLICSPVEHHAVLQCFEALQRREGFDLTLLPVDTDGRVDPSTVQRALRPDTVLVSVMAANNETGVLQPVAEIGRICRSAGVLFHTDAVQWFGKEPFGGFGDFHADLVTFCAHKLHGPRGAGMVVLRSPLVLQPHLLGGPQEQDRRAGTENLVGILGLAAVVERFLQPTIFPAERLRALTDRLVRVLRGQEGVNVETPDRDRLANTVAFTVAGSDSMALLANLDLEGICASSGSACSAGSVEPSHVLLAQGRDRRTAGSLVRFSLGRETTEAEVDAVCTCLPEILRRARGF